MASTIFNYSVKQAKKAIVPNSFQTEFSNLEQIEGFFASYLTYTFGDFSNSFHKDHDYNTYCYGIWASILAKTGELVIDYDDYTCIGG